MGAALSDKGMRWLCQVDGCTDTLTEWYDATTCLWHFRHGDGEARFSVSRDFSGVTEARALVAESAAMWERVDAWTRLVHDYEALKAAPTRAEGAEVQAEQLGRGCGPVLDGDDGGGGQSVTA